MARGGHRRKKDEENASLTGVCKCIMLTDFSAHSQRSCAKLQAKLTVKYEKVFSFRGSFALEPPPPPRGSGS